MSGAALGPSICVETFSICDGTAELGSSFSPAGDRICAGGLLSCGLPGRGNRLNLTLPTRREKRSNQVSRWP